MRMLLVFGVLAGSLSGCGGGGSGLAVPRVGTEFIVYGIAGGDRALAADDMRVVRASDLPSIELPSSENLAFEVFYAGLRAEDLPAGLAPDQLRFVQPSDPRARRLPLLIAPHVLATAVRAGEVGTLVAVNDPDVTEQERVDRAAKLAMLTAQLKVQDPCSTLSFETTTPRTQGSQVVSSVGLSDGTLMLGMATTGTAIVGALELQGASATLREVPLDLRLGDSPIVRGESAVTVAFSTEEVQGRRLWPREIAILRGEVLGGLFAYTATLGAYRDLGVSRLDPQPGRIRYIGPVELDGVARRCASGSATGTGQLGSGARLGVVWCEAAGGGPWEADSSIMGARSIVTLISRPGRPAVAIDASGTAHERRGAAWRVAAVPAVNQRCGDIPCEELNRVVVMPSGSPALAVMAGTGGQLWKLVEKDGGLATEPLETALDQLFGDERSGPDATDFEWLTRGTSGALYAAPERGFILRIAPDLGSSERICLPRALVNPTTHVVEAASGALVVATTPITLAIGRR